MPAVCMFSSAYTKNIQTQKSDCVGVAIIPIQGRLPHMLNINARMHIFPWNGGPLFYLIGQCIFIAMATEHSGTRP